jgi:cullin-4
MRCGQPSADVDLRRTLQSLACGKQKVLKKKPAGPDVNESDVFYFSDDYTNPRYQVRIDSIQAKETVRRIIDFEVDQRADVFNRQPEENKRTEAHIEADRKQELDAAIVRIMKAKKKLTFEQIKSEVIIAVKNRFVPEIKHIKQRVDCLVESEYLKRDEDVKDLFVYLA